MYISECFKSKDFTDISRAHLNIVLKKKMDITILDLIAPTKTYGRNIKLDVNFNAC